MKIHFLCNFKFDTRNGSFSIWTTGFQPRNEFEGYVYGNLFSFTIMILFLLSFLGILSVWSDILQEEGNCIKEKNLCQKSSRKFKNKFKKTILI